MIEMYNIYPCLKDFAVEFKDGAEGTENIVFD